jgi:putative FmdB family regulatory protein
MPTYSYWCYTCEINLDKQLVPIEERDFQECPECGLPLKRVFEFRGAVWAPTSGKGLA